MNRKSVCSQQVHCLSCPLSKALTGKDCRELTQTEIRNIMSLFRQLEALPIEIIIESLDEYLSGTKDMYINGKWYEEPEINAYVSELEAKVKSLQKRLEEAEAKKAEMQQLLRECMRILAVAEFDFQKFSKEADEIYDRIEKMLK